MASLRDIRESKRNVDAALKALGKDGKRRVRRAVGRGEAVSDEQERAAAVLLARHVHRYASLRSILAGPRWLWLGQLVSLPVLVATGVWLSLDGDWLGYLMLGGLVLTVVAFTNLHFVFRRARERAARAEELNS